MGRKNQSRFTRWVSGGQEPASRKLEQEAVTLVPDKETYQPGDTAQILVQSPFTPAEGLLTVSRSGILYTTRFHVEDGSATLDIPIEEKYIPNLSIQVDLVGSAPRTDDQGEPLPNVPPRPAYATAQLDLSIPPLQRTLSLQATPDQSKLEPGGETTLSVTVKDAKGSPVSDAELAVVVVDEAILALTNYQLSDPLSVFYEARPSYLESTYGRYSIILADPQLLAGAAHDNAAGAVAAAGTLTPAATEAPAMEAPALDESQAQQAPINIRSDFNPLATFAPTVRTGSDGEARVSIKLPDNLTRYRVMVVAVDQKGNQFGTGESNITARLPLMVRPSAPRFLNFGDKFELPVVLQNQTDAPMTVDVVARATNLELDNPGLRVDVPANDRIEVRFPASTDYGGNDAHSGRSDLRGVRRRRDCRTACLYSRHHGGIRHLRRDRRGRGCPICSLSFGCLPTVWRAGDQHLFHCPASPDRRGPLFKVLSLRKFRPTGFANFSGRIPAGCVDSLQGRRFAISRRNGVSRQCRYRPSAWTAKRGWRLPLLAARLRIDPLQHDPCGACPVHRRAKGI